VIEESRSVDVSLEPLDEFVVVQPVSDETGVDAGDKVLYPRDAGFDVRLGGLEVKVLKREELIARIHD
jgi:co-chaperonin GroES (HSP10)